MIRLMKSFYELLLATENYVAAIITEWVEANFPEHDHEELPPGEMKNRLQAVMEQEMAGFRMKAEPTVCPMCGGSFIDHGDWVECDTCEWSNAV